MVSFLPRVTGAGVAVWAFAAPIKQHNSNIKPINFIFLLNTKIM
jgi:hypothetical protein